MKRVQLKYGWLLIFITFLSTFIFYSCNNANSLAAPPSSNMTANLGGTNMIFNTRIKFINNIIYIIGDSNGYQLQLFIVNYNPNYLGSYKLDNNSGAEYENGFQTSFFYVPKFVYSTDSTHTGVLNVTSYNPTYQTISGDFSFNALQDYPLSDSGRYTISVTNGTFFIKLN